VFIRDAVKRAAPEGASFPGSFKAAEKKSAPVAKEASANEAGNEDGAKAATDGGSE